jgi:glycosyltransferase involved in cell wall biosynthesis
MKPIVALLGHTAWPTDGVMDYCQFLGQALAHRGVDFRAVRVPEIETDWLHALSGLWRASAEWGGKWVLLQYTALGWSRRGFPFGAVAVILLLRARGVNCGVVFHEAYRQGERSANWIRLIRGAYQEWVIRLLHRFSLKSVFTIPLNMIPWLPDDEAKSAFIPLGANVPESFVPPGRPADGNGVGTTVVVFCVSDPPFREREIGDISYAMRSAAGAGLDLRIIFLGKGTREAHCEIEKAFEGIPVRVVNLGLCDLPHIARTLAEAHAMLCVRGKMNLRRGSALAGIACGVPIVGYSGAVVEGTPLADAGIEFVREGDRDALGSALTQILTDRTHWQNLHQRNVHVQRMYFRWESIAASLIDFLNGIRTTP